MGETRPDQEGRIRVNVIKELGAEGVAALAGGGPATEASRRAHIPAETKDPEIAAAIYGEQPKT